MRISVTIELDPGQWTQVVEYGGWLKSYLSSFPTIIRMQGVQMTAEMQNLRNQVDTMTSVVQGGSTLLDKLANMIREKANDPAALRGMADDLQRESGNLAASIARNTPGDPENTGGGSETDTSQARRR